MFVQSFGGLVEFHEPNDDNRSSFTPPHVARAPRTPPCLTLVRHQVKLHLISGCECWEDLVSL